MIKKWISVLFSLFLLGMTAAVQIPADELPTETAHTAAYDNTQISSTEKADTSSGSASKTDMPYFSSCGALHVEGTALKDHQGNTVQLRGISTHGLAWFPDYINGDCFRQLREDFHANAVRLAMYTAESGGYCTDGDQEALRELVRKGVNLATEHDLYAIIDWHILSDSNPNQYKEEAIRFFDAMSDEYADHTNILYEICNEPNGATSWPDIKAYACDVIDTIRSHDPDAVILVGTPNWSQFVDQAAADPITGYDNLMYTLHFYAATHKEDLRTKMTAAIESGLPVFVSEYGICDASGNGQIDEVQADAWVKTMDQYDVSYMMWNLSNKEESSAMLQSTCQKVSGFKADDLSAAGKWVYRMLNDDSALSAADHPSGSANDAPAAVPENSDSLICSISLANTWEADGNSFWQYTLTLRNDSEEPCSGWTVEVPFSGPFSLSDGWNGNYTVTGETLCICAKDYNREIPARGQITDIGFIVSGSPDLSICSSEGI